MTRPKFGDPQLMQAARESGPLAAPDLRSMHGRVWRSVRLTPFTYGSTIALRDDSTQPDASECLAINLKDPAMCHIRT